MSKKAINVFGCCRVEAVVAIDSRGQLVLPKDVRVKAGIKAGDKLAVTFMQGEGENCCVTLVRAEALTGMVRQLLGPMVEESGKKEA